MSELQRIGKKLEQTLLYGQDHFVVDSYKSELEKKQTLKEIARATGIQDLNVLGTCIEQNLPRILIMGLKLTPFILVAWSDGKQSTAEKEGILKELKQDTDLELSLSQLLEGCLGRRPRIDLKENYIQFLKVYLCNLSGGEMDALQKEIMGGCENIARASRSFWTGHYISGHERAVLSDIGALF